MRYRWVFLTGLAIGFVLGTRAGRERYEEMRRLARKVADNPAVQQAPGALRARATVYARAAGERVPGRGGAARAKVGDAIHEHAPGMRVGESDGRPAHGGNGRYAQAPGTAGPPPGG